MRNEDRSLAQNLRRTLRDYSRNVLSMPGINDESSLNSFIFQIIESIRRIRFVKEMAERGISPERKNPNAMRSILYARRCWNGELATSRKLAG